MVAKGREAGCNWRGMNVVEAEVLGKGGGSKARERWEVGAWRLRGGTQGFGGRRRGRGDGSLRD